MRVLDGLHIPFSVINSHPSWFTTNLRTSTQTNIHIPIHITHQSQTSNEMDQPYSTHLCLRFRGQKHSSLTEPWDNFALSHFRTCMSTGSSHINGYYMYKHNYDFPGERFFFIFLNAAKETRTLYSHAAILNYFIHQSHK